MYMADRVVIAQADTTVVPIMNDCRTTLDVGKEVVGILTLIIDPIGSILVIWTVSVYVLSCPTTKELDDICTDLNGTEVAVRVKPVRS